LFPSGISDLRESSIAKWFESGAWALKIGAQVFTKENISAGEWSIISHNLKELMKRVKHVQSIVHPN
jgi:2-keto-3-deoxy-6-phosphogluconate aldolase